MRGLTWPSAGIRGLLQARTSGVKHGASSRPCCTFSRIVKKGMAAAALTPSRGHLLSFEDTHGYIDSTSSLQEKDTVNPSEQIFCRRKVCQREQPPRQLLLCERGATWIAWNVVVEILGAILIRHLGMRAQG